MDPQTIISVLTSTQTPTGLIGLVLSLVSLAVAVRAIRAGAIDAQTNRANTNSWQTYIQYNDEVNRRARRVARALADDPEWQKVTSQRQYYAYFGLDPAAGPRPGKDPEELRGDELSLHTLLNYYHQVGILLNSHLLDDDFTMSILGGGLHDRWAVIGRIPLFFRDKPYSGVYLLHNAYLTWYKHRFPQLNKQTQMLRDVEARALGIADPSL
jgi:hypothetical protein